MTSDSVIAGAYVSLEQLLAIRHKTIQGVVGNSKVVGNRAGQKLSKIKGRGVDFAETRTYQPGDDIRSIDWRVTARKNKPHTKVFREERERPTLVCVDQCQNMFFGSRIRLKSVAAVEVASRIAWQNLGAGDRVGGIVIGNTQQQVHRPYRTTKAVSRFLAELSQYNQQLIASNQVNQEQIEASLNTGLLQLRRLCKHNYRIFIVSDFSQGASFWRNHIHELARRNEVVLVHISDPLEAALPPSDHYAVTDGAKRLQFYTGDDKLTANYRLAFEQHCEGLKQLALHHNIAYRSIETSLQQLDHFSWL